MDNKGTRDWERPSFQGGGATEETPSLWGVSKPAQGQGLLLPVSSGERWGWRFSDAAPVTGASDGPPESEQPALSQDWQARAACGKVSFLSQDHSVDQASLNILPAGKEVLTESNTTLTKPGGGGRFGAERL